LRFLYLVIVSNFHLFIGDRPYAFALAVTLAIIFIAFPNPHDFYRTKI